MKYMLKRTIDFYAYLNVKILSKSFINIHRKKPVQHEIETEAH